MVNQLVLNRLGLAADALLFLSALLLLIDIAPRDLLPRSSRQKAALASLRENHNLLLPPPPHTNFRPDTQTLKMVLDEKSVRTLAELIRTRSPLAHSVPWDRMVGIGFSTVSAPVGEHTIAAFQPLYVAVMPPKSDATSLELIPVGQLEDVDRWLYSWHQSSLTFTAASLLTLGFLLQLLIRFVSPR